MVLRKPYKFLIRHFRFIHLVLAIMSTYLLTRTNALIKFYNDYLNNNQTLVGTGTSKEYFTGLMVLFCIGVLLGSIIILVIMKMKDKPVIFYIINIAIYLLIIFVYLYDNSLIKSLETNVLNIRTIKLASDITLLCFLAQTFSTIILYIRAVGFNIKKFDFASDLQFDINEHDNEEFEFDLSINKSRIRRNFIKSFRNFKYTYHENKFIINIIILAIILIIGFLIYYNLMVLHRVYRQNQYINTTEYTYTVSDSYLINTDYRGKEITDNYLVVTKLKIRNNSTTKKSFETARVLLQIGKVSFNPTVQYKDSIVDLGTSYTNQKLSNKETEYLLTFEIPKKYINKKKIFTYSDPYSKKYKTKLSVIKFDKQEKTVSANIKEEMLINNKLFANVKFKINNYILDDKIKSTYRFCETSTICYESYEYIVPTLTDNYVNTIMEIDNDGIDISDFIEMFGSIEYTIGSDKKTMSTPIKEVIPTKSASEKIHYFEVYSEIKNADSITLVLNIRNNRYEYKLK